MARKAALWAMGLWLYAASGCPAHEAKAEGKGGEPPKEEVAADGGTLTGDWFGAGEKLAAEGLSLRLSATQVYQGVIRGGLATHRHAGRYTGTYDLEIEGDLEKLARLKGGSFYILAEGGWSPGLDAFSVGSLFNVNADALGDEAVMVSECWYEQAFLEDRLRVRVGKLDLTGGFECRGCPVSFDGNSFANDETTQFLNGALVNNPTIPFPDRGIGAIVHAEWIKGWYVSAGVGDTQADARETGFNTAFKGPDYFLSLYETGVVADLPSGRGPLKGAYRAGLWYDPQPKEKFDGTGWNRDDVGLYVSADQMVWRESADPEEDQGLGLFGRFGLADPDVNPIRAFYSIGGQYRGLIPGRDEDVLGVGLGYGRLTDEPEADFTSDHESVLEVYYRICLPRGIEVSPSLQYVSDPGGQGDVQDAVILGVRIQMAF
jgi:porin